MNIARPTTIEQIDTNLRRVLAPNPSPMTYWGTNTYIVGTGNVAVIAPGPNDPAHLENILRALGPGENISHIFVTHSHVDHSPLAKPLALQTGAPVLAFGRSHAGRSAVMQSLVQQGDIGGGEGVDLQFNPDIALQDGSNIQGESWQLQALWTPGHMGNHLSFRFGDMIFTGDHIMGWASSLVSPPDGDLNDFIASTERLAKTESRVFHPGHGAPIHDPTARSHGLIAHRRGRETTILAHLSAGPSDATVLTAAIYKDTPARLIPAARRNVFAHLVALYRDAKVTAELPLCFSSRFELT